MQRTKRQKNDMVQISNSNKKQKLGNQITTINSNKYCLEDLANEILYEIFGYLNGYDIYKGFYNLNNRFQNLAINSNILTKINISTISKSNFEDYYHNILIPNQSQINFLRLSNPFVAEIIFSEPRLILNFIRLETIILDYVQEKNFNKFFDYLICLTTLHAITIFFVQDISSLDIIFSQIFRLSTLKYFKIEYQQLLSIDFTNYDSSSIEYLIIKGSFPFSAFHNLLCCLPKLQHLSINHFDTHYGYQKRNKSSSIQLKYLKHVSLKLNFVCFDEFEKIIKEFFHHIQILRLTTSCDEKYLDAKRWQQLILFHIPYLHYSLFHLFRRKDYTYNWEIDEELDLNHQRENSKSVKHLYIACGRKLNRQNYFPNVIQLTISCYVEKLDDYSFITNLECMISLKQLTKLDINIWGFPFEEIIKLLRLTPNLYTLRFNAYSLQEIDSNSTKYNILLQHVLKKNKIENLLLTGDCSLNQIRFIVYVFSKLKYLKIRINSTTEISSIIRYLLSKTHNQAQHLFYLCISQIPEEYLKEIKDLIKLENLLDNYSIQYINNNLHLWW
ncbi:unnamed protein product [Rotaria sordida]|uniref:F-box domain-containing protein n=5 Tax=Rotaria sordida TaxID=392033 RepID=A0A815L7E2_9BILA|nr:unnamed protein product [Rotaria sordida]CAF1625479.1 unnamed protein product [Rotaria sordida]